MKDMRDKSYAYYSELSSMHTSQTEKEPIRGPGGSVSVKRRVNDTIWNNQCLKSHSRKLNIE